MLKNGEVLNYSTKKNFFVMFFALAKDTAPFRNEFVQKEYFYAFIVEFVRNLS